MFLASLLLLRWLSYVQKNVQQQRRQQYKVDEYSSNENYNSKTAALYKINNNDKQNNAFHSQRQQ